MAKVGCLNCNLIHYNVTCVERNELVQRMSGGKERKMVEPFGKHYSTLISVRLKKLFYFQMEVHKIIQ